MNENDLNVKIRVTDTSNLNSNYKEAIQEGTYESEDLEKFINTLKTFDQVEKYNNQDKKDFSKQSIGFEIITDKEKIPLNIRLGQGNFEKGLTHLINMGSTNMQKDNIEQTDKNSLNKYLQPYSKKPYNEMLDGTFKAIKNLSEIINKDIASIIEEFSETYKKTKEKSHHKKMNKQYELNSSGGKEKNYFFEKMGDFFKKKLNKMSAEKIRTNEKIYSQSR